MNLMNESYETILSNVPWKSLKALSEGAGVTCCHRQYQILQALLLLQELRSVRHRQQTFPTTLVGVIGSLKGKMPAFSDKGFDGS